MKVVVNLIGNDLVVLKSRMSQDYAKEFGKGVAQGLGGLAVAAIGATISLAFSRRPNFKNDLQINRLTSKKLSISQMIHICRK